MKKLLLLLLLVSITIMAAGQTIPNSGFEIWNSITYETPRNYPVTSGSEALSRGEVASNVVKVSTPSDVHGGSYAVKLSTSPSGILAYLLNADAADNPDPANWTGGIAYTQTPSALQGYYKYHSGNGTDQATVIVTFRDAAGVNIGTTAVNIGGEKSAYTLFTVSMPTLTGVPAKVIVAFASSDLINGNGKGVLGSALYLDDVSFTGVGITQPALLNGGFEDWDSNQTPFKLADWHANSSDGEGVSRTTDKIEGSYALQLTSYMGRNNQNQPQPQNAQVSFQDFNNSGSAGGFPCTLKAGKLVFSYKYTPIGSDKAQVMINFKNGTSDIGGNILQLSSSANYQTVEISFNLGQVPDMANIIISSSDWNNTQVGSVLIIDNLHFIDLGTQTWTGNQDSNWNNSFNWSLFTVPNQNENVIVPQVSLPKSYPVIPQSSGFYCNNLTIESGAVLTISDKTALTVNGSFTNNNSTGTVGLILNNNSCSLIVRGSVNGTGAVQVLSSMSSDAWHIISSPLSGQRIDEFLTEASNINAIGTSGNNRGMMDYDPTTNSWNTYFTNTKNGILETGKGFAIHTQGQLPAWINFKGALRVGDQTVPVTGGSGGYWNCIGNPYTSAIGITDFSSASIKFLTDNASKFEPSYGAIYIWNQPDANNNGQYGQYTISNNTYHPIDDVLPGQAFMVNMNSAATSVTFRPEMQLHNTYINLKSKKVVWPTIKLQASFGDQKSSTVIAFNNLMTKGLDPTYDAGLLKGTSDLIVYSRLVEDNGIPFAIQALPDNDYSNMIIPIGLDFKTGGEVIFSSELMNLPTNCKAILEDKLMKTFTDLSTDVYKTTIAANSSISNRFFLHTSNATSLLAKKKLTDKLTAYANRNIEIRLTGNVTKNAVATLYDLQGRIVLVKKLEDGNLNIIPTPNVNTGIYMLSVKDNGKINGFKILVKE